MTTAAKNLSPWLGYQIDLGFESIISEAYLVLGVVYILMDRPEDAIEILNRGLRLFKDDTVEGHTLLGSVHLILKKYSEATAAYRWAVQLNPQSAGAYLELTATYSNLG